MPNWCSNSLRLTATTPEQKATIKRIKDELYKVEEGLSEGFGVFNYLVPCPTALTETTKGYYGDNDKQKALEEQQADNLETYGYSTWYDFAISEWGTKWDACDVRLVDNDDEDMLEIDFDTAWSPPEALYNRLTEMGFAVEAVFCESGCDFIGYYRDGECVSEPFNDGSIDYEADECWEACDQRLESYFFENNFDFYPSHTGG